LTLNIRSNANIVILELNNNCNDSIISIILYIGI